MRERTPVIQKGIFRSIVIATGILILLLSTVLCYMLSAQEKREALHNLKMDNELIRYYLENQLKPVKNTVEILSNLEKVKYKKDKAIAYFKLLRRINPIVKYIYAGYEDGSLLIDNYIPPKGFDSRVRPWYQAAMKAFPEVSTCMPYQEIKTKEWLISISKAFTDEEGKILGVVSADIPLQTLVKKLKSKMKSYKEAVSFVTDYSGRIIIHPDPNLILIRAPISSFTEEPAELKINGKRYLVQYTKIPSLQWIAVTMVPKRYILIPIIEEILLVIYITGAAALIMGWALSSSSQKDL